MYVHIIMLYMHQILEMYRSIYVSAANIQMFTILAISGVRYSNFSYHDIGAISITIQYISRYNLWFEITMKYYYEVNN